MTRTLGFAPPNVLHRLGFGLMLSMPLVALTNIFRVVNLVGLSIRPTDLLFVVGWVLWCTNLAFTTRLDRPLIPFLLGILGLLLVSVLGVVLLDNSVDWPRYVRFVETMSWGVLAFTFVRTEKQIDRFTNVAVLATVIMGGVSLGLYLMDPELHRIAGYVSFAGAEGLERQASYNEWGALFAVSIAILLWHWHQGTFSIGRLIALAVVVAGLLLAQSRSAFLAVTVVILIVIALRARRAYLAGLPRRFLIALAGLLIVSAAAGAGAKSLAINRLTESFLLGSNAQLSIESRFELWHRSLALWPSNIGRFILGYGSQSFVDAIGGPTAESFYLDHGLSEGLLGLLLVLAILIWPTLKARRGDTLPSLAGLSALVLAVGLTVSLTGNVLVDPTYGGITFSLLYGLLSVRWRRHTLAHP